MARQPWRCGHDGALLTGRAHAAVHRAKREAGLADDEEVNIVTLPLNRLQLPGAVRTIAGALAGPPPDDSLVAQIVPHRVRRALGALLTPGAQDRAGRPLALAPFFLDID